MASISEKVGDLGEFLREQREGARLSVRQLATLAGVSNPYLSQVERGLRKPSAEVLQQIAKGLRISAEVLYIRAGILDSEGRPDVEAAIAADALLTDRQRRALLDIYASFRAENLRAETSVGATPPTPPVAPARAVTPRARKAAVTKARVSTPKATASTPKATAATPAIKRTRTRTPRSQGTPGTDA
ncbi:MAG: helix-turn-helix transcriptional regulator [Kineosporiaceae bacterium]